jgi:hypothetical protein
VPGPGQTTNTPQPGPSQPHPTDTGPTQSAGPRNRAHLDPFGTPGLNGHRNVSHCIPIHGTADLAAGVVLWIAIRKTDIPSQKNDTDRGLYFFHRIGPADGGLSGDWTSIAYFGLAADKEYEVLLLTLDVATANRFWASVHHNDAGQYADAPYLPPTIWQSPVDMAYQTSVTCSTASV